MFLVSDSSTSREERIREILTEDPPLAVLLSVIHFEWTVRRAIIALGVSLNIEIRDRMKSAHGHKQYKEAWQDKVFPKINKRLPEIVDNWDGLIRSFKLRHRIVHGINSCGREYAEPRVDWAVTAAYNVRSVCTDHGVNLDGRLPVRRQRKG
ncbi:MAG: hypothetical protein OHK0012_04180 [Synechococcales cyanobacterium]